MYSTLVSVALFSALAIQGALADFTVDTPTITQCGSVQLKWDSTGAQSYNVAVVPAANPCDEILRDLGDHTVNHITWTANIPAGQQVMLSILDSDDNEAWSGAITVQKSDDASCLATSSSSVSASSSTLASASASSGTTLVVNAGAAASTAPAAPSSSGATAVGAANSGVLGNGAFSVRFSAPSVALGAIVAIAALAF
ncbi:hypothetical protein GSI_02266 [Ganoderma sinense ZZ0214-1]|uniref:Uncharacterized protein n=1 Tax=Ganoderma sinense ZZ0214-1 TaxID=1077348 RepID=A0A2G8SPN4_9APHY|nr:hypothetical protein GSI_02266 [Ganoderma sinense ZZ0214-1]